jgi:DNA-binding transcriptional MerR regulator
MVDMSSPPDIPKGTFFKAAEVCELVKVQPYVLRSWEVEFPELGVVKTAGGARVYRRVDVEQVMRIKHLLLVEGLTLAGARRRLEEEAASPPVSAREPIAADARDRLGEIKRGLRSILDLLSADPAADAFVLEAPVAEASATAEAAPSSAPAPASPSPAGARPRRSPVRDGDAPGTAAEQSRPRAKRSAS